MLIIKKYKKPPAQITINRVVLILFGVPSSSTVRKYPTPSWNFVESETAKYDVTNQNKKHLAGGKRRNVGKKRKETELAVTIGGGDGTRQ